MMAWRTPIEVSFASGSLMVLPPYLRVATILGLYVLPSLVRGPPQRAHPGGNTEARADECQPGIGMELSIEPLSTKQSDEHTQTKLETDSAIGAEIFQFALQMTVHSVTGRQH